MSNKKNYKRTLITLILQMATDHIISGNQLLQHYQRSL